MSNYGFYPPPPVNHSTASDWLRREIHKTVFKHCEQHPETTVYQLIGALEVVKLELIAKLNEAGKLRNGE